MEQFHGVKSLLELQDCDVCGGTMHPKFLQNWNGQEVCKYCIKNINEEAEAIEHHTYDQRRHTI